MSEGRGEDEGAGMEAADAIARQQRRGDDLAFEFGRGAPALSGAAFARRRPESKEHGRG